MAPGGIEPTTFALLARRSNQLSYGAADNNTMFHFLTIILIRVRQLMRFCLLERQGEEDFKNC